MYVHVINPHETMSINMYCQSLLKGPLLFEDKKNQNYKLGRLDMFVLTCLEV